MYIYMCVFMCQYMCACINTLSHAYTKTCSQRGH